MVCSCASLKLGSASTPTLKVASRGGSVREICLRHASYDGTGFRSTQRDRISPSLAEEIGLLR